MFPQNRTCVIPNAIKKPPQSLLSKRPWFDFSVISISTIAVLKRNTTKIMTTTTTTTTTTTLLLLLIIIIIIIIIKIIIIIIYILPSITITNSNNNNNNNNNSNSNNDNHNKTVSQGVWDTSDYQCIRKGVQKSREFAGKSFYQERFHHTTTESLFAGDSEDLEICVEQLRLRDCLVNDKIKHVIPTPRPW